MKQIGLAGMAIAMFFILAVGVSAQSPEPAVDDRATTATVGQLQQAAYLLAEIDVRMAAIKAEFEALAARREEVLKALAAAERKLVVAVEDRKTTATATRKP